MTINKNPKLMQPNKSFASKLQRKRVQAASLRQKEEEKKITLSS